MKFLFENLLTEDRKNVLSVDGIFPSALNLGHWPGNNSPPELKADTSTEMAFKLIESEDREKYLRDIEIISNNHFDSDGVIAAYVLLFPDDAVNMKNALIDIAVTGDFMEFTTEDALKADKVLNDLQYRERSLIHDVFDLPDAEIMNSLYLRAFELLPELVNNIDNYEDYFREDFNLYSRSVSAFDSQTALWSDYNDCHLTVIESGFRLHPVSVFSHAGNDIVLTVEVSKEGRKYELKYKPYTWHDTLRQKQVERKTFETLSKELNLMETNKNGLWRIIGKDPISDWDYGMNFSDENSNLAGSKIEIYKIEEILFEYFFE
jgi:hypothetical protein